MRKEKELELKSAIEELIICNLQPLFGKSKFLVGKPYQCTMSNGRQFIREKLLKNGEEGSASIILPITKSGEVLLAIEPRVFTKEKVGIGLPAGYINPGETFAEGALRELKEETGYVPLEIQKVGEFYQDEGCSSAYNYGILALDCEKKFEPSFDHDEYVKTFQCTIEEAYELLDRGDIRGANSQLTMIKAKEYIKKRYGGK